jgi:hypothetical protein
MEGEDDRDNKDDREWGGEVRRRMKTKGRTSMTVSGRHSIGVN